jgi:hypothetical protein
MDNSGLFVKCLDTRNQPKGNLNELKTKMKGTFFCKTIMPISSTNYELRMHGIIIKLLNLYKQPIQVTKAGFRR